MKYLETSTVKLLALLALSFLGVLMGILYNQPIVSFFFGWIFGAAGTVLSIQAELGKNE